MTSGIYLIMHKISNIGYVGQSKNIELRWGGHRSQLRVGKHFNQALQITWDEFGESFFQFSILEEITDDLLLKEREAYFIYHTHENAGQLSFNLSPVEKIKKAITLITNSEWGDSQNKQLSQGTKTQVGYKVPYLRAWRERQLMSQDKLSEVAGIGKSTIIRLESGKTEANGVTVEKIARGLGITRAQLLGVPEEKVKVLDKGV